MTRREKQTVINALVEYQKQQELKEIQERMNCNLDAALKAMNERLIASGLICVFKDILDLSAGSVKI